jgi:PIN domain nuclease of toxin-antitoxin system
MDLLLDTHAVIWWWTDDGRLSDPVAAVIADEANRVLVSAASAWEISTKERSGKLRLGGLGDRFDDLVREHGFTHLPVTHRHATWAGAHGSPHRDPFDRMLAAQAAIEGAVLATIDPAFSTFGTSVLW